MLMFSVVFYLKISIKSLIHEKIVELEVKIDYILYFLGLL